jgi:UDP-N-acetylmuramate: L-alanyl-gamma-D-glutamyl-meso-diaminopimelate ligase
MHVHILGICGTFMAGIAALARESGHQVSGADAGAWPPMSSQLEALGISVTRNYDPAQFDPAPDIVVVGNVISRGNPAIEYVLDAGLPYVSGPQWLKENVLRERHVLAVAGTHGKTTTTSLLAWLLERAGLEPGFLVGGVPLNFGVSARLGASKYFVIEADEYDTAFFDKRSKFVHYGPRTLVLNNLEYDHADIFPDLAAIERQFHHLVRTVPASGRIIVNGADAALGRVLQMGCWSECETFNVAGGWHAKGSTVGALHLTCGTKDYGCAPTTLGGLHNASNSLAAIAAAAHLGVDPRTSLAALAGFRNVRRRLERIGVAGGVQVFDDFAHHPTAVAATIAALRESPGRILAVLEPRSNSMRQGAHADGLAQSLAGADQSYLFSRPDLQWDALTSLHGGSPPIHVHTDQDALVTELVARARTGDRVLLMSNGDFGGIHAKLLAALSRV